MSSHVSTESQVIARGSDPQMFDDSGRVASADPLVTMLYLMARDHVSVGEVERLVSHVAETLHREKRFTNGWLAQWAKYNVDRLRQRQEEVLADGTTGAAECGRCGVADEVSELHLWQEYAATCNAKKPMTDDDLDGAASYAMRHAHSIGSGMAVKLIRQLLWEISRLRRDQAEATDSNASMACAG
jgi:hypothetical protein